MEKEISNIDSLSQLTHMPEEYWMSCDDDRCGSGEPTNWLASHPVEPEDIKCPNCGHNGKAFSGRIMLWSRDFGSVTTVADVLETYGNFSRELEDEGYFMDEDNIKEWTYQISLNGIDGSEFIA